MVEDIRRDLGAGHAQQAEAVASTRRFHEEGTEIPLTYAPTRSTNSSWDGHPRTVAAGWLEDTDDDGNGLGVGKLRIQWGTGPRTKPAAHSAASGTWIPTGSSTMSSPQQSSSPTPPARSRGGGAASIRTHALTHERRRPRRKAAPDDDDSHPARPAASGAARAAR
jgi:hypothetical protein